MDRLSYTLVMNNRQKVPEAGAASKKGDCKLTTGSNATRRGEGITSQAAAEKGTTTYHVSAPVGGKTRIQTILRKSLGPAVKVEEVRDARNKVSIRHATADEMAELEIGNIEREFAVRKALLARARSVEEVSEMLGIKSRQTLHNWHSQGKIIALLDNGRLYLPLWQFEAGTDDKLVAGFSETLRTLKRTSFSAAHWFTNPNGQLGNRAPIALLRAGEISKVLAEAKHADIVS
jgi:hypothetical protein